MTRSGFVFGEPLIACLHLSGAFAGTALAELRSKRRTVERDGPSVRHARAGLRLQLLQVWRRLRALGAIPLKRSAYLLPDTPERYEDFQWLAQEILREGGEATLIRVRQIENVSPQDVLRPFHEPRDRDYKQLAARYRKVLKGLDKKSAAGSAQVQEELARLVREHQRIRDIDFFEALGGAEVRRLERARTAKSPPL